MKKKRILIIGAGQAGEYVCKEVKKDKHLNVVIVGFIDDDPKKQLKNIVGKKVLGGSSDIGKIIKKHKVQEILIAIPSADGSEVNRFVDIALKNKVSFKIISRIREIIQGKVDLTSIRKVEVHDLLGRPVVKSDVKELTTFLKNKKVLVTGAAGSIGSELSLQIASYKPKKLILLDASEGAIFELRQQFISVGLGKVEFLIANVRDEKRIEEIFEKYKPDFVYHAAAYKHVPLMEENPTEAIKNNILGTYNLVQISLKQKVKKFVFVSTDKAAKPKNVMGMTKLIAEMITRSVTGTTKFMVVRFGNVLNSNGSVIPTFRKQIDNGGPITVTDKRMTRFFMTIPEAAQLILKSSRLGDGGELFVLDMGKPVSILSLAEKMIRLSGYIPNRDIKIVYSGIRKGEKINEELFTKKESLTKTLENKIFIATNGSKFANLNRSIRKIQSIVDTSQSKNIKSKLRQVINDK